MAEAVSERKVDVAASSSLCSICFHPVKDARVLSCLHSFCKTCIDDLHLKTAHDRAVSCPLCRARTSLPEDGAAGLAKDITRATAKRELECESCKQDGKDGKPEAWCQKCDTAFCKEHIGSHLVATGHHVGPLSKAEDFFPDQGDCPPRRCSQHSDLPLRHFCKKCMEFVCGDCVLGGAHAVDNTVPIKEISAEIQRSARNKMDQLESVDLPRFQKSLTSVKHVSKSLSFCADKCRSQISAAGTRAVDAVQAIVKEKLMEVDDIETIRVKGLDNQEAELKRHVDNLERCLSFGHEVLKETFREKEGVCELLLAFHKRVNSLRKVTIAEEPVQHAGLAFQQAQEGGVRAIAMQMVGELLPETASAHYSQIDSYKKHCVIWSSVSFAVLAKDNNGEQMTHGGDEVEAEVLDIGTDNGADLAAELKMDIKDRKNGTYLITCMPQQVGKYTVQVSINGQKMQNRLSLICVTQQVMSLDPTTSRGDLTISDDLLTVMHAKTQPECAVSVLGSVSMQTGIHTWKVRVQSKEIGRHAGVDINAGIVKAQRHASSRRVAIEGVGGWRGVDGKAVVSGQYREANISAWKANDVLKFDLNCNKHILRVTNLRTGESDAIYNLPAVELFAGFTLGVKAYSATLIP